MADEDGTDIGAGESSASQAVISARLLINALVVYCDVITVLVKAIQLSGWVFHMKVSDGF